MKHKGNDLTLLVWDGSRGKFDRFILNPALQQNTEGEYHVIAGQRIGEL